MRKQLLCIIAASCLTVTSAAAAPRKPAQLPAAKPAVAAPAEKKPDPLQLKELELARKLVDTLGFGEGLPEKPEDKDYLQILAGNRTFKFEAEEIFDQQSDPIAVRDYPLFGPFSGRGWVHGSTGQLAVHFKVFIPVSGKYTLKVAAKGDNQLWSVAGKAFKLSSGDKLRESILGQVFIPAGELEFNALIPPAGAIDYFVFSAPDYTPIEPFAGWNPAGPLTAAAVNETLASLLALEALLPDDPGFKKKIIEAASIPGLPERVRVTDNQVKGKSVASKWVRAFQTGATLSVPLEIEASSVYRIRVRAVGTELSAGFGQRKVTVALQPELSWVDLGTFRLTKGSHSLGVQLPPTGGIDIIEVSKKLSSAADYAAVTKAFRQDDSPLTPAGLDSLLKTLKDQFKERK